MKKTLSILLMMLIVLSLGVIGASAEDSVSVYVTIADANGNPVVAAEKITVTDTDNDGALTISDALYLAHEAFYEGGAAAGYGTAASEYGMYLQKLWGNANGGSYGYYVNNTSAWSLTDPVSEGSYVYAFTYTDLTAYSDNYSYFDAFKGDQKAGEPFTLTLTAEGKDAEWNPFTYAVADAAIYIDGVDSGVKTDAEGKATITLTKNGTALITAKAAEGTITPPVYLATVTGAEDETEGATATPDQTNPNSVPTGSGYAGMIAVVLAVLCGAAVIIFRKKAHEK